MLVWALVVCALSAAAGARLAACPRACRCTDSDELVVQCFANDEDTAPDLELYSKVAEYVELRCNPDYNVTCERIPSVNLANDDVLPMLSLQQCPPALVPCALAAVGARGAQKLWVARPPAELEPADLRGVGNLTMLVLWDAARVRRIPFAAVESVPSLREVRLTGAALGAAPGDWRWPARGPGAPALRYLELSGSGLTRLPAAAFRGLDTLTFLNVFDNPLQDISEDAFLGLSAVETLNLNKNNISRLPPGLLQALPALRTVTLSSNRLAELPDGLFDGTSVENITLNYNKASLTLAPRAFADLPALTNLVLKYANVSALPPRVIAGSANLSALVLSHNGIAALPADLFAGHAALRSLDLSYNRIAALPDGLLLPLRGLVHLDLDRNHIEVLPDYLFTGLRSLRSVSMNDNLVHAVSALAFHGAALRSLSLAGNRLSLAGADEQYLNLDAPSPFGPLAELETLDLSRNRLAIVFWDWRVRLLKLRTLNLTYNRFTELTDPDSQFLSEGLTVDLRHNSISSVQLYDVLPAAGTGAAPRYPSTILLDHNPLECDCGLYRLLQLVRGGTTLTVSANFRLGGATCARPPGLAGRPVRDVAPAELTCDMPPPHCPPDCYNCTLHPHSGVLALDCPAMPARLPDLSIFGSDKLALKLHELGFASVPDAVAALDLSGTGLRSVDFAYNASALESMDLSNNELTAVPLAALRTVRLALANNSFECSCAARAQLERLQALRAHVTDYEAVTCGGRPGRLVSRVEPATLCGARDALAAGGGAALALLLAAAALALAAYLYADEILVVLVTRGLCRRLVAESAADAHKRYDAFVSFAHQDEQYVRSVLLPRLEGELGRRACVHYRDWVAGELIPLQIVRSVQRSRRTLIVLSRSFLQSVWARLEFRAAHAQALRDGRARVLLLVLDDAALADERLDAELRAYVATNTYLRCADPRFWQRLRRALPARSYVLLPGLRRRWARDAAAEKAAAGGLQVALNDRGELVNEAAKGGV